jgi:amino acid transporter
VKEGDMAERSIPSSVAPAGVFTRASSGLVRQVKTDDVLYYGWCQIALSYLIFIVLAWSAYPGASMEWAAVLATVGGVALGLCYAMLVTVYPRSGGEYVFISRIIHPAVGFAVSFSFAFWQMFYYGVNGAFLAIYALSPFFGTLGVQANSSALLNISTWFSSNWGIFLTGSFMIIFFAGLQARGMGRYFRVQRYASYIAIVSLIITIIVLALAATGVLNFQANFDHLAGSHAYQQIVAGTHVPGGSVSQTLKFMIWPAFSIWFAVIAVSFSGEVKNVQRGQMIGINGAMITMGLAAVVLCYLYRHAFGSAFLLSSSTSAHYHLAAPPYVNVFTGIAGGNVVLTILTFLWVLAIAFFVGATCLVYSTRALLAWSIDGVAPERLGDVNERYHSPHWAILVSAIVAEIWLGFFAFTKLLGPISGFLGFTFSFLAVSLTAIVFPFIKRDVFESSPIAWRVGRVPVITIVGVVSTVFMVFGISRILVDKTYTPNLAFGDIGGAIVLAVGAIAFYVARAYRRSRGVNIDQRYREIPIE